MVYFGEINYTYHSYTIVTYTYVVKKANTVLTQPLMDVMDELS